MPRPKLPDNERLVAQPLRISPAAKQKLSTLTIEQKKEVIAEMRKAVEHIINQSFTVYRTHSPQNNHV